MSFSRQSLGPRSVHGEYVTSDHAGLFGRYVATSPISKRLSCRGNFRPPDIRYCRDVRFWRRARADRFGSARVTPKKFGGSRRLRCEDKKPDRYWSARRDAKTPVISTMEVGYVRSSEFKRRVPDAALARAPATSALTRVFDARWREWCTAAPGPYGTPSFGRSGSRIALRASGTSLQPCPRESGGHHSPGSRGACHRAALRADPLAVCRA